MEPAKLIGLVGKIGAGKTTVARRLNHHGFTEYSFSDPLKQIASIFGFNDNQLYGTQAQKLEVNEEWGISGREFMQKFGTEVCRDLLPKVIPQMDKVWIRCFEGFFARNDGDVVVGDVRFVDEADTIRRMGGKIIRIISDGDGDGIDHSHASETEMDAYKEDFVINNKMGDLYGLYRQITRIVDIIRDRHYTPLKLRKDALTTNHLMELMEKYPDGEWYYARIMRNPNITWRWLYKTIALSDMSTLTRNCQSLPMDVIWGYTNLRMTRGGVLSDMPHWSFSRLSENPSITEEFIESFIEEFWNWEALSRNTNISWAFALRHQNKYWDWTMLSAYSCLDMSEGLPQYSHWEYLSMNATAYDYLTKNVQLISWDMLCENPKLTATFVHSNQDKPWNMEKLSKAPCITPEFVHSHPNFEWDWAAMSANVNIDPDFLSVHDGWDEDKCAMNPALVGMMFNDGEVEFKNPGITSDVPKAELAGRWRDLSENLYTKSPDMVALLEKRLAESIEFVDGVKKRLHIMQPSAVCVYL